MRRGIRLLGTLLASAGVLTLLWALLVWQWQDPFTAVYTKWKQHQLASQYDKRTRSFEPTISGVTQAAEQQSIAREAKQYRRSSRSTSPGIARRTWRRSRTLTGFEAETASRSRSRTGPSSTP